MMPESNSDFHLTVRWALVSGAKSAEDMGIFEKMGPVLFALVAVAIQAALL